MQTYSHSGTVPMVGAVKALLAGAVASAVLGIVYCFTFYYVPYVYLNFLMAVGVGAGTGYVVGQTAIHGKIRNVNVVGTIALVAALAGLYAEWGTTIYALQLPAELPQFAARAGLKPFLPQSILMVMAELFARGSWGLSANAMVTGWPLVTVWLVEAGLILVTSLGVATSRMADRPFCERCQEWIDGLAPHFYVGDGTEPVWTEVQSGTFETLALTPRADGSESTYVKLTLRVCDGCSESNYLTITACCKYVDAHGHQQLKETAIIKNLALTSTQADIVQAANVIAPSSLEVPLALPPSAGNWTLQGSSPSSAPIAPPTPTTVGR
jgi:hypothetical protein